MSRNKQAPKAVSGGILKPERLWWLDLALCLVLLAAVLAPYSQVRHFDFVNYDDPEYVTKNEHVQGGLSGAGMGWAIKSFDAANWFPLTWLTHMADVQFFGMDPGWHHLSNVWLHALNTLLLFGWLKRVTGARWPSVFVAFVFALHPLHVESVAWIAERKDVLCSCCWFAALWCYVWYAAKPGVIRYSAVALAFALGLMAKPMIVTLPLLLLLLDVWPLRRPVGWKLLLEKLPLMVLATGAAALTFFAQRQAGAVATLVGTTPALRVENALVSYVVYIRDLFWPVDLAVLYPLPSSIPFAEWAGAAILLAALSAFAARQFRTQPYLAVGWCWYLISLAPVIGLIQVGSQAHADRYMYVPAVGLFVMLAWGAADAIGRRPALRKPAIAAAVCACLACLAVTWTQIQYWQSTETLDLHALSVTTGNFILRHNLADYYLQQGRYEEARRMEAEALHISPQYLEARLDLALALSLLGRYPESETEYRRGLALQPEGEELIVAHSGLGAVLASQHRLAEALPELQLAARLRPGSAEAHFNLGSALAESGRAAEAAGEFAAAVRLESGDPEAHYKYALVLTALGKNVEAAAQLAEVARLRPDDPAPQYDLALTLMRTGQTNEAIRHLNEALRLNPGFERAQRALAGIGGQAKH